MLARFFETSKKLASGLLNTFKVKIQFSFLKGRWEAEASAISFTIPFSV